jgi:hypothetical protein
VSTDGKVSLYNDAGKVDVIIDVVGYYEPAASGGGGGGAPGPAGPAGPAGAVGPAGPAGPAGAAAVAGVPSGTTVIGSAGLDDDATTAGADFAFTFMVPGLPLANFDVGFAPDVLATLPDASCTGTAANPTAPPGKVCVYRFVSGGASSLRVDAIGPVDGRAVQVTFRSASAGDSFLYVSWAYTATWRTPPEDPASSRRLRRRLLRVSPATPARGCTACRCAGSRDG